MIKNPKSVAILVKSDDGKAASKARRHFPPTLSIDRPGSVTDNDERARNHSVPMVKNQIDDPAKM